jgi:hypothetical protein
MTPEPSFIFLKFVFSLPFFGIGLLLIISGIGLFQKKNWARRMGMFFAGLLEMASLLAGCGLTYLMSDIPSLDQTIFLLFLTIFICSILALLLALYMLQILGGPRMVHWTAGNTLRPVWVWQIFYAYLASIIGVIPAFLLLIRKPAMRILAQIYSILLMLMFAFLSIGFIFKINPENFSLVCLITPAVLFYTSLCIYTIRRLNKPEVRAYFENREN